MSLMPSWLRSFFSFSWAGPAKAKTWGSAARMARALSCAASALSWSFIFDFMPAMRSDSISAAAPCRSYSNQPVPFSPTAFSLIRASAMTSLPS